MRSAVGRVAALDSRLASSSVDVRSELCRITDLDGVPVLSKDTLPALQKGLPPFGGLLSDDATVARIFASPGPIYEAQLDGPDPWRWAPALRACGIGPADIVLNCFSYHLSPAGAMFDEACRAVGATVVPGGVGATEVQVQLIADVGVTAYVGLPSYLASLVQRYDEAGLAADRWLVSRALVTAEPLPVALREQLTERIATVLMAYGTAEVGLLGYEQEPGDGLSLPDGVFIQVCDPGTGQPVDDETPGEVVATLLHPDYPLLRFGTGDVSRWQVGDDGLLRLAGVLGRVGAAVKVRGMFIHPHQAGEVIGSLHALGAESGRFVVERPADKDVLRLELVCGDGAKAGQLVVAAEQRAHERLRVRPEVRIVKSIDRDSVLTDTREWS